MTGAVPVWDFGLARPTAHELRRPPLLTMPIAAEAVRRDAEVAAAITSWVVIPRQEIALGVSQHRHAEAAY